MRWIREHKVFSVVAAIVVVLILVIVGSFVSGGGSSVIGGGVQKIINTVEKPFAAFAGGVKDTFNGIFKYKDLQEENEQLKEENKELKESNNNLQMQRSEYEELQDLAKAFDFEPFGDDSDAVAANVIGVDNSMIYRNITVDVGEDKGIKEGDVVVDGNGLVGEVTEVNGNTSKISSILDTDHNISFMVQNKTSVLGVLNGQGKSKLSGYLIDDNANIAEGDTLVTSGMGHYPKGIIIGRVSKVEFNSDTQLRMVEVRPTANFKSMTKVAIFK